MQTLRVGTGLLMVAVLCTSCDGIQKAKEAATAVSAAKNYAENVESGQKKAEERRAKGDTLAIAYTDLQQYLPASVAGYEKDGEPEGQTMNMSGMSYSTAAQSYKKGDETLKITVTDYNGAYALFGMATAMMSTGYSMENADEKVGPIDLGVGKGYETIRKKDKNASVVVALSDRFFVQAEASGQENADFVKEAVKSMDLSKLSGL
ncbi:MAG: hypothetical protein H7Y12_15380 [Sphingobacteriaceae bacterium]|nr:hypothetical protein [Cytophagaceae bacterium]